MSQHDAAQNDGTLEIAIIGGGIAGLTLAIGLLNRGVKCTIYERGCNFREIGAGIGFTPNAERAMKVLDPRIHTAFKRVTVQNGTDWFIWMDGGGDTMGVDNALIHKMYLGKRGFEGCHRAEFLDELVKMIPEGTVKFSKKLVSIADVNEHGKVEAKFSDGSSVKSDAVVGCDGIRSKVRQLMLGEDRAESYPKYTHKYAFRGLIPMERAKAALGNEKTETRHMYLGPDGHALTFPVAGGKLLNVVAFTTDPEEWPHKDRFTGPATKADAVKAFAHFNPIVRTVIDLLPDTLDKWAVFDTFDHPAPTFATGLVCIAGDAAHAAAPYHGAGAGFAVEDAAVLAYLLFAVNEHAKARLQKDPGGSGRKAELVREALQTYNAIRLERAHWLVQTSRYIGDMYQWQDPKVGSDHEKLAEEIDWRCRKIWHFDVDGMMEEAKESFQGRF